MRNGDEAQLSRQGDQPSVQQQHHGSPATRETFIFGLAAGHLSGGTKTLLKRYISVEFRLYAFYCPLAGTME